MEPFPQMTKIESEDSKWLQKCFILNKILSKMVSKCFRTKIGSERLRDFMKFSSDLYECFPSLIFLVMMNNDLKVVPCLMILSC